MTNQVSRGKSTLDYEKLVQTEDFKGLVKRKKSFSTPFVIFFLSSTLYLILWSTFTNITFGKSGWVVLFNILIGFDNHFS